MSAGGAIQASEGGAGAATSPAAGGSVGGEEAAASVTIEVNYFCVMCLFLLNKFILKLC